jgi:DNA polymerase III alpha subunit
MWNKSSEEELVKGVITHGPEILEKCLVDPESISKYLERLYSEKLEYPIPRDKIDIKNWFIPTDYQNIDIENFLLNQCPEQNHDRLNRELDLYRKHDMIPILKTMKYIVDTLRKNNVVWGVGRGSSVASYALFLLGVHKVDSVKYKLPLEEFFKGEKHG